MVKDNKICFISCVNDDEVYKEAIRYIRALHVPEGFAVELIGLNDAKSITQGYNEAMKRSDAKYKVYMHQDVFIIDKNFINNVIRVFKRYPEIGMMGVTGAGTIPAGGIWWESRHKYGKVYENHTGMMELLAFNQVDGEYRSVKAVDGLIMITQYDIPWREDIFTGWHFYDASQSMEFQRAGYEVAVPKQDKPWCIHDCGLVDIKEQYHKYREVFLDVYSKDLFPLVSIMITAYNRPDYLRVALGSALNQTYKNIEIIVCDNSTNNDVQKMIQPYLEKYSHIRYYKNEKSLKVIELFRYCLNLPLGEYACYLMDDDIYHKDKIKEMVNYFLEYEDISLVTSYRQTIDEKGRHLKPISATQRLFEKTTIIDGKYLVKFVLETLLNVIGETTTPLFRRKDIEGNNFGVYQGRQYETNADMATWFTLLFKGKAVYIPDALSYFRLHGAQDQRRLNTIIAGAHELFHLIEDSYKSGIIENEDEYKKIINTWLVKNLHVVKLINSSINGKNIDKSGIQRIYECFDTVIKKLLNVDNKNVESIDFFKSEFKLCCTDEGQNVGYNTHGYKTDIPKINICKTSMPLVSILIPAYNRPHYLEIALNSALNQTYKNIEIIIGDDSTNDEVQKMLQPYLKRYKNIRYYNNGGPLGGKGIKNAQKIFNLSRGEFINYLSDDDIFHEDKIRQMLNCFFEHDSISLVTSYRKVVDEKGNPAESIEATKRLFDKVTVLDGKLFVALMVKRLLNIIGEPTTVLFRKKDISDFGKYRGKQYTCIADVAMWLSLLLGGNAVYMPDALSYFRVHKGQNSADLQMFLLGVSEWLSLVKDAYKDGFIENENEFKDVLNTWLIRHINAIRIINEKKFNDRPLNNKLYNCFDYTLRELLCLPFSS